MSSVEELSAQAAEQLRLYEDQKEENLRKQEAAKNSQNASLQEKLNARLKKKEEKAKAEQEKSEKYKLQVSGDIKVKLTNIIIHFENLSSILYSMWCKH